MDAKIRSTHRQFYLMIYPETDAHVNGYICGGGLDLGLNENGINEARKISRRFKRNPLKIKKIIGSPELRAVQMADILHDEVKVKLVLWSHFADQFMGEWEGRPLGVTDNFKLPPKGESAQKFKERVELGAQALLLEKDLCFVVTHARVAELLLSFLGLTADSGPGPLQPGTVYVLDLPAGTGQAHIRTV